MSENTITAVGHRSSGPVRSIRARLLVDGVEHPETRVEQATWNRTRYSRADMADLTLAVDRVKLNAAGKRWFDPVTADGALPPDVKVALQLWDETVTNATWKTVFSGLVDRVRWSPTQTSVEVECRDMLAKLLDLRVREAWMNKTGPEVIKAVASAAGLTADVTLSAGMTGQFWQLEHKRSSSATHHKFQTAFDLARYIADEFGCDLYAEGETIVCKPVGSPSDSGAHIHAFHYNDLGPTSAIQAGALSLTLERDFLTSKNVVVHVMSWDSRQRTRAETYFSADGHSRTLAENMGTLYSYRFPGLRQEQIERKAEALYRQIIAHDRTVSLNIPGRITLEPRHFMRFSGTGSTWDLTGDDAYAVDAVSSTFGADGSFLQDVTLRNREASNGGNSDSTE